MDIRTPGWFPYRDGREDLGEGIGRGRPCVMRFGMEIRKDLCRGGLDKGRSRQKTRTHASEDS
jgi:hypothetical protein